MLIYTDILVSAESFRKEFDRHVAAVQQGNGPVAITRGSRVVGVFMSPDEYEALHGAEIRELLESRERGRTVSHDQACNQLEQAIQGRSKVNARASTASSSLSRE